MLEGRKLSKDSPVFRKALQWLRNWPSGVPEELRRRLLKAVCTCFSLTEAELYAHLEGLPPERLREALDVGDPKADEMSLYSKLPSDGWLRWYADFTLGIECPLSFLLFTGLSVVGAALGRRVWIDQGFFKIWPCYNVLLVGPTGKVKKTVAIEIAKSFVERAAVCPVFADKITPERLVYSLANKGAHQLLPAPEFSVLLGKQRYNEGMAPLMLRLMDYPEYFRAETMSRDEEVVQNVAITVLAGSTISLLISAMPEIVSSGGFLNRFVVVVERDTARCFPRPRKGPEELERKLLERLRSLVDFSGEVKLLPDAEEYYSDWYQSEWKRHKELEDETTAELLQRFPDHFLRTAMLIHIAHHDSLEICAECCVLAAHLLRYVRDRVPHVAGVVEQISKAKVVDAEYVFDQLRKLGGAADHSTLLRRVCSRMTAKQFKEAIDMLEAAEKITVRRRGVATYYLLRVEVDDADGTGELGPGG